MRAFAGGQLLNYLSMSVCEGFCVLVLCAVSLCIGLCAIPWSDWPVESSCACLSVVLWSV